MPRRTPQNITEGAADAETGAGAGAETGAGVLPASARAVPRFQRRRTATQVVPSRESPLLALPPPLLLSIVGGDPRDDRSEISKAAAVIEIRTNPLVQASGALWRAITPPGGDFELLKAVLMLHNSVSRLLPGFEWSGEVGPQQIGCTKGSQVLEYRLSRPFRCIPPIALLVQTGGSRIPDCTLAFYVPEQDGEPDVEPPCLQLAADLRMGLRDWNLRGAQRSEHRFLECLQDSDLQAKVRYTLALLETSLPMVCSLGPPTADAPRWVRSASFIQMQGSGQQSVGYVQVTGGKPSVFLEYQWCEGTARHCVPAHHPLAYAQVQFRGEVDEHGQQAAGGEPRGGDSCHEEEDSRGQEGKGGQGRGSGQRGDGRDSGSKPVQAAFGYLEHKGVGVVPGLYRSGSVLLIPLKDENQRIVNLQRIWQDADGKWQKRYQKHATRVGTYFAIKGSSSLNSL